MNKILVLISITLFTACASYKPSVPTQKDADRAAIINPGITLAELTQGKSIFEESCVKCHSLKTAIDKSDENIKSVMPEMAKKAHIDSSKEDLVLKYLTTMNRN